MVLSIKKIIGAFIIVYGLGLCGCAAVHMSATQVYQLNDYSAEIGRRHATMHSIIVNKPDAVAGYQTEQMQYIQKSYTLNSFGYHAWVDPPADMLFPLIVQSLQASHYFTAVVSSPITESTDYRLDTEVLALYQDFMVHPSHIILRVKVVLTQVTTSQVIASTVIQESLACPQETPYGGVIAANRATRALTKAITQFVVRHVDTR